MLRNQKASPYFEVIVNGSVLSQYATSVEIIQEIGAHPLAFLRISYIGQKNAQGVIGARNSWKYLPEFSPVAINYGMRPGYMGQFLGYVGSYRLVKAASDIGSQDLITTIIEYTIVGTSQLMQTTVNRTWKNISPSSIASSIAVKNGFRAVIHPYTAAINYRVQSSSDFTFLADLAEEIGYHFYVDNTDLYFVNPKILLDRSTTRKIPQFWMYNKPGLWDSVRSFEPIVGTITPDGGIVANRTITGLNPRTRNLVSAAQEYTLVSASGAVNSPLISKYYNIAPAESYYEAQQKVQASTNNNQYWLVANSVLRGDFRVRPNMLIEIAGSAIPDTESGVWLVRSTKHCLSMPAPTGHQVTGTYEMYTTLMRDQVYTANVSAPGETDPVVQPVPAVLRQGIWKSSNIGAQFNAR